MGHRSQWYAPTQDVQNAVLHLPQVHGPRMPLDESGGIKGSSKPHGASLKSTGYVLRSISRTYWDRASYCDASFDNCHTTSEWQRTGGVSPRQ